MIGKIISHYKIIEKLGAGGMGTVYKAQDLNLDRSVALKFLSPHLTTNEEEKQRFVHEAKAASALDHNNICAIYEINETGEQGDPSHGKTGGADCTCRSCAPSSRDAPCGSVLSASPGHRHTETDKRKHIQIPGLHRLPSTYKKWRTTP